MGADEAGPAGDEDLHGAEAYLKAAPTLDHVDASAAGITNPRARQRALAIAALPEAPGERDPLAELKELLRTAGVATAGEMVQQRSNPTPTATWAAASSRR